MKVKSLEELYKLLFNYALLEAEATFDLYITSFSYFGLKTKEEIIEFLKKYLAITKSQEDSIKDMLEKMKFKTSYYFDTKEVLESIFNVHIKDETDNLYEELLCVVLTLLYWDDILYNGSKLTNKLEVFTFNKTDFEEVLNYKDPIVNVKIPKEVNFI